MDNNAQPETVTAESLKELLNGRQFLAEISDEFVERMVSVSEYVKYQPNQIIIDQGEDHRNLFFIVSGSVDVFVDGGRVATLSRKGDLLGEMSAISQNPSNARIVAGSDLCLLKVDTLRLKQYAGDDVEAIDLTLYRMFSRILADKLNITNDRAKNLEDILSALSKTKSEIADINRTIEVRVAQHVMSMQKNLQSLLNRHLSPLREALSELNQQTVDSQLKNSLVTAILELTGTIKFIEPLTTAFKTSLSIKNKKILIVDGERKQQLIAKMALGGTGVKLTTALTVDEAKERLEWDMFDLVISSLENLQALDIARQRNPNGQYVAITSESAMNSIAKLRALTWQPDILARDDLDRASTTKHIMTTVTKLLTANVFGIEKYLNWGSDIQEMPVANSVDRHYVRQEMHNYFVELGVRKSMLTNVDMVAEEMLMNAVYDAPTDQAGKPLYNHLARTQEVELTKDQQPRFRYGFDGEYVAIAVEDPFGGLRLKTIFDYLESCYTGKPGLINERQKKGGAGRGLHQIVENSTAVVFNVAPHVRTEVIALFYAIPGEKRERPRQIHYFSQTSHLKKNPVIPDI